MTTATSAPTAPSPTAPEAPPADPPPPPGRLPLLLIVPTLVLLVAALGYPVGWQLMTSLRKFGLLQQFGAPAEWVGLDNYASLVTRPRALVGRAALGRLLPRHLGRHRGDRRGPGRPR